MPNNLSNYAENLVLDWLMGGSSPTRPANRYLALYTAAPSDAGGGTEVTGGGYARQAVTCGAAASGSTSNSGAVAFTASGAAYGLVTHVAVLDALTTGNFLWWGPMTASKQVDDGDTLNFAIGALTFGLD